MFERIKTFFKSISHTKLAFLIIGIGSTVWFLMRVIPKPTRAGYPCMKAAAPIMSGFRSEERRVGKECRYRGTR